MLFLKVGINTKFSFKMLYWATIRIIFSVLQFAMNSARAFSWVERSVGLKILYCSHLLGDILYWIFAGHIVKIFAMICGAKAQCYMLIEASYGPVDLLCHMLLTLLDYPHLGWYPVDQQFVSSCAFRTEPLTTKVSPICSLLSEQMWDILL